MGTVQEKGSYLRDTKELIRGAIINKGVQVSVDDTFRSYAEKIGLIQGSGGNGLGPYAQPNITIADAEVLDYPTVEFTATPPADYVIPEDWYDLEEILDSDTEDYPAKMIVMYPNDVPTATLYGANFYRCSDGTTYTAASLTTSQTHTWDSTFDRIGADGQGYRYVISYFTANTNVNYMQARYNTVNSNAIAVITKGFRWQSATTSSSSSYYTYAPFYNRRNLVYFKAKDSDWSDASYLHNWFRECTSLRYCELDFNNGNSVVEAPKYLDSMFDYCYALTHPKFSMPENVRGFANMFYQCYSLEYLDLDFTKLGLSSGAFTNSWYDGIDGLCYGCHNLKNIVLRLNPERDRYIQPWLMFYSGDPLKVSQITITNSRSKSTATTVSNIPSQVVIEASNDHKNWTVMSNFKPEKFTGSYQTSVDIDDTVAYQYWRFRCVSMGTSGNPGFQNIAFTAKYEKSTVTDGVETKEWVDWVQPVFTSYEQDNCKIYEYDHSDSYYGYYAFNGNLTSTSQRWLSSTAIQVAKGFTSTFNNISNLETLYVVGAKAQTVLDFSSCSAKYIIFDDTSSVVDCSSAFSKCSRLKGIVFPHSENVKNWSHAFEQCTSLEVAPAIIVTSRIASETDYMFEGCSSLKDISYLDLSQAKTVHGMFRGQNTFAISDLKITLPEALRISSLFYNCDKLKNVEIHAPYAVSAANCFESAGNLVSAKILDINSGETFFNYWDYSGITANDTIGQISTNASVSDNSQYLYKLFNQTSLNSTQNNFKFASNATGSVVWKLPYTVRINDIKLITGFQTGTFTCQFFADEAMTIPISNPLTVTDEELVTYNVETLWSNEEIEEEESPFPPTPPAPEPFSFREGSTIETDTIVFYISESSGTPAINQIILDGDRKYVAQLENLRACFSTCTNLRHVEVDGSKATNMRSLFYSCSSISEIPNIGYDSAINMYQIFYGCSNLTTVIQPDFPCVEDLYCAFYNCSSLKEADLSNISTVTNMESAFYSCTDLAKLTLNMENVTNAVSLAGNCKSLRQATLGNTSKVTNFNSAFSGCLSLVSLSELDVSSCTSMTSTFSNCEWIQSIPLKNLDLIQTMDSAFQNCKNLKEFSLPDLPKNKNFSYSFEGCNSLETVTVGNLPVCTNASYAFKNCYKLTSCTIGNLPACTTTNQMFCNCYILPTLTLSEMPKVTDAQYMFEDCRMLTNVYGLSLPINRNYSYMFYNCYELKDCPIKTTTSDSSNQSYMQYMFYNCKSIEDWSFLADYNVSSVCNMSYMFAGCAFSSISLSWDWRSAVDFCALFENNPNLTSVELDFKNRSITYNSGSYHESSNHGWLFNKCPKLQSVSLKNTSGLKCLNYLYAGCALKTITVNFGDFADDKYIAHRGMFESCPNLESVILDYAGRTDSSAGLDYQYRAYSFKNCKKLKSISISNCENLKNCRDYFKEMNNEELCTVNWNNSEIKAPYFSYGCCVWGWSDPLNTTVKSAGLHHINLNAVEENPGFYAFSTAHPEGACLEPMYQSGQISIDLPVSVKVSNIEFVQRSTGSTSYEFPSKARFYADKDCTTALTPELSLTTSASEVLSSAVSDVVTDHISCKFGQDLGRYQGVGQINVTAQAKAKYVEGWTQPVFTSHTTWGVVSASEENAAAWHALDGILVTEAASGDSLRQWEAGSSTTDAWWGWTFNAPLSVRSIRVYQRSYNSSYHTNTVTIKTHAEGEILLDTTSMPQQAGGYVDLVFEEPRILTGIHIDVVGSAYVGIGEVQVEADGYYEYLPWNTEDSGELVESVWYCPILESNTSYGVISATSEIEGNEAYKATTSSGWLASEEDSNSSWSWTLPTSLKISEVYFNSDSIDSCTLSIGDQSLDLVQDRAVSASGFNESNRYSTEFSKTFAQGTINSFEIQIHFWNGDHYNGADRLFQAYSEDYDSNGFFIQSASDGVLLTWLHSSYQTTYAITDVGYNQEVWARWVFDGTTVFGYNSSDGRNWKLHSIFVPSEAPYSLSTTYLIGNRNLASLETAFPGTIDLSNTFFKINDEIVWSFTDESQLTPIGSPVLGELLSGFNASFEPIEASSVSISPNSLISGKSQVSIFNLDIVATEYVSSIQIVDFSIPNLYSNEENGYKVTFENALKKMVYIQDQGQYLFDNSRCTELEVPAFFSNMPHCYRAFYFDDSNHYSNDTVPRVIKDLDFYAPTTYNSTTLGYVNDWFGRSQTSIVKPSVFVNPKNINGSINLSSLNLTKDSILELLDALVSKVGTSACTFTIGSSNLSKLTDEEKAIATSKNWNLA